MPAMLAALGLIPGLQLEVVEAGCCGMAGSFGLQAENHEISMAMAEAALLRDSLRAPRPVATIAGTS